MHLQVVADSRLVLLDAYTGYPGSVHDARVLRASPVFRLLTRNCPPASFHLLGDSAYPLTTFLLTPYRDNGHLTEEQRNYNKVHASTRVDVERAIGLLKGKWRRLKYLDMHDVDHIPQVIMAACVLHNFVLLTERHVDEDEIDADDTVVEADNNDACMSEASNVVADAEVYRRAIASLLM